jgi:hypothetical protein
MPKKNPNAGRSPGSKQTVTTEARLKAAESGLLPHEWLLKVARGEPVAHKRWKISYDKKGEEIKRELLTEEYYADFPQRIDAAKAAAPYYMPKLATQIVKVDGNIGLTNLSDEDLKTELLNLVHELPELLALIPGELNGKKRNTKSS